MEPRIETPMEPEASNVDRELEPSTSSLKQVKQKSPCESMANITTEKQLEDKTPEEEGRDNSAQESNMEEGEIAESDDEPNDSTKRRRKQNNEPPQPKENLSFKPMKTKVKEEEPDNVSLYVHSSPSHMLTSPNSPTIHMNFQSPTRTDMTQPGPIEQSGYVEVPSPVLLDKVRLELPPPNHFLLPLPTSPIIPHEKNILSIDAQNILKTFDQFSPVDSINQRVGSKILQPPPQPPILHSGSNDLSNLESLHPSDDDSYLTQDEAFSDDDEECFIETGQPFPKPIAIKVVCNEWKNYLNAQPADCPQPSTSREGKQKRRRTTWDKKDDRSKKRKAEEPEVIRFEIVESNKKQGGLINQHICEYENCCELPFEVGVNCAFCLGSHYSEECAAITNLFSRKVTCCINGLCYKCMAELSLGNGHKTCLLCRPVSCSFCHGAPTHATAFCFTKKNRNYLSHLGRSKRAFEKTGELKKLLKKRSDAMNDYKKDFDGNPVLKALSFANPPSLLNLNCEF